MGFFSNLFGKNKEDNELKGALEGINRILSDENFQIEILPAPVKDLILSGDSYDRNPLGIGPFGFSEMNAIPVNGPIGELAYLSRLETLFGQRIMFHRLGSMNHKNKLGITRTVDVYETVSFDGKEWNILYLDFYHPRRSREYPQGFKETTQVPQFTGFNKSSKNFPYEFSEMKANEQSSGLSFAYIALSKVMPQINAGLYNRPPEHVLKLNEVKKKLSFIS
jgi:hypothetical protein